MSKRRLAGASAFAAVLWLVLVEITSGTPKVVLFVFGIAAALVFCGLPFFLARREAKEDRLSAPPDSEQQPPRKTFLAAQAGVMAVAAPLGLAIGHFSPPAPLAAGAGAVVVLTEACILTWWIRGQQRQWHTS